MADVLTLPDMPFYWRTTPAPGGNGGGLPARLPFTFSYDADAGLLIEERSPTLSAILEDMYRRESNVGFLQDGHNLAKGYGDDFWRFFAKVLAGHKLRRILEIGCGGCLMLERLRSLDYEVVGVDPSPIAVDAGKRKGIEVIQDFFPTPRLTMEPDLIFHVDVLEHAEDPVGIMRQQHDALRPGALAIVNVPDSSSSILVGDISMAMHQHVNMFDEASLSRTLARAGFDVLQVERSRFGASLYALARKPPAGAVAPLPAAPAGEFARFKKMAVRNIAAFGRAVAAARAAGGSLGFFMPMRAFPYLATLHLWEGYRIFDNMNAWHRRYFDGLGLPVENQLDLFREPVDHLFVMSLTFGEEVKKAVAQGAPATRVTTLASLIRDGAD